MGHALVLGVVLGHHEGDHVIGGGAALLEEQQDVVYVVGVVPNRLWYNDRRRSKNTIRVADSCVPGEDKPFPGPLGIRYE